MKKRSIILLSSVALLASSCAGNGFNKEKMIEFANEHTLNVLQIEAKYDSFKSKTVTTLDDNGNEEFATYAAGKKHLFLLKLQKSIFLPYLFHY